ncbi:MAG: hypothetical protein HQL54_13975, partial [Magnetococcales bacterium]|nr:hypothetical protein [Magnetococcales bacterium]
TGGSGASNGVADASGSGSRREAGDATSGDGVSSDSGGAGPGAGSEEWVTQTEFAKRRGCDRSLISRWVSNGKIPAGAVRRKGRACHINFQAAMAALEDNLNGIQGGNRAEQAETGGKGDSPKAGNQVVDEPPRTGSLRHSQERIQMARADRAEIELKREAAKLIPVRKVEKPMFTAFRLLRDQVMSLGTKIAGQLAAETDEKAISELVENEVRLMFREVETGLKGTADVS